MVVGGWWWVLESEFSDRLWLSFSLALAKPNTTRIGLMTHHIILYRRFVVRKLNHNFEYISHGLLEKVKNVPGYLICPFNLPYTPNTSNIDC